MANDVALSIPDFAAKATENYSHFIAQAQEFLSKIYRGEVTPSVLQERLPAFLQERGATYHFELQQVCFQFFRSLMILSAKHNDEFFRGLLPDMPASDPLPFAVPPQDLHDWTHLSQACSSHIADQHNRMLVRYHHVLMKISRGELTAAVLQEYANEFSKLRGPESARQAAEDYSLFYDGLLQLNQRVIDDMFRYLDPGPHSAPNNGRSIETLSIDLTGASGSTVSASLVVENKQSEPCNVSCVLSEFRNSDGLGPGFRAALAIEPSDLRLLPEETRTIGIQLVLDPVLFIPSRTYISTLVVKGQGEMDVLVFLTARATA